MKNLYLLLICTLLFPICLFAQGENDNWYFGNKAGLDFSTNPPTALLDGQMDQFEGVATVSDSIGQLLFYTDGVSVWDKTHNIMPNGTGLTGDLSSLQSAVIAPHPSNPNLYFLFTVPKYDNINQVFISYSIVDMTKNNNLGDVDTLNKNIALLDSNGIPFYDNSEAITVTKNANGNGYWVLLPFNNTLYSYPINNTGFVNLPVTSSLTFHNTPVNSFSHIRVSNDNSKLAITRGHNPWKMRIYNFNSLTGMVDISFELGCDNCILYSSEFSSDSNVLYSTVLGSQAKVIAFDLVNLQVRELTPLPPNQSPPIKFGTIQRTKWGDLYIAHGDFNSLTSNFEYLSKIINSNNYQNSYIDFNSIYLGGRFSKLGLPQLVPQLSSDPSLCPQDLVLSSPESNNNFEYEVSNSIITNNDYLVDVSQNIILSAGNAIEMHPNTFLKAGSFVLAKIEGCVSSLRNNKNLTFEATKIFDLDSEEKEHLKVYPNPVKDRLSIQANEVVTNVKIYDFSGNLLLQTNPNTESPFIDMINFKSGIYFVEITMGNSTEIVRVIK